MLEAMSPSRREDLREERPESREELSEGFGSLVIVGVGLIGGSLALALRAGGYRGRIVGVSRPETIEEAVRAGVIDRGVGYEDLAGAAAAADLIVLSSPIARIIDHLAVLGAAALREGVVITDVGSTKRRILDAAAASLPPRARFIGGHPLAGSQERGVGAADPFLFQNAYYVLTPPPGAPAADVERLGRLLVRTGARLMVLDAPTHDAIAAAISHLPQLLAVSLVRFLDGLGEHRADAVHLAAGGFRDMTRIASSPYSVWRDIIETNRDAIGGVVERFLEHVRATVLALDGRALEADFERAARTRAEIPRDTKGFLSRLWNVLVVVEDRPGVIAGIAAPLAARGINVKDIEVLKVREGEGGSLRLAFATRELAEEAAAELGRQGYAARLREE
jgi:prephenate dehydrogenase